VSEHTSPDNSVQFVQRAGIYLLNSLACHVDGQQKLLVGSLGAMEKMLALIRDRVTNSGTDAYVKWFLCFSVIACSFSRRL
jgi:hypothetical protein